MDRLRFISSTKTSEQFIRTRHIRMASPACTCMCMCAEEPHDFLYGKNEGNGPGVLYFAPTSNSNNNSNGTDINVGMFGRVYDNDAPISAVSAPVCRVMDAGMVLLALCRLRFKHCVGTGAVTSTESAIGYFQGDLQAMERTLFEVAFLFRCPWGFGGAAREIREILLESRACDTPADTEAQSEGKGRTEVRTLIDIAEITADEVSEETLNQVREDVVMQTAGVPSAEVVAETSHFFNVAMIRELAAKARHATRASIERAAAASTAATDIAVIVPPTPPSEEPSITIADSKTNHRERPQAQALTQPGDEGEAGDQILIPSRMKSSWPWSI